MELLTQITDIVGRENVLTDEPMSRHTTFLAGGPAAYFVTPQNEMQLAQLIKICPEYYVIGRGSNLLVRDAGYSGVILYLGRMFSEIRITGNRMIAGAGAKLSEIAARAAEAGLTGFEFAHGIPGTLGGAVVMNAGAYGGEMKDVLTSVRVLNKDGEIEELPAEALALGYRHSLVPEKGWTVLSAELCLQPGVRTEIEAKMQELMAKRREKQPLEFASAGSTFKRPEGHFAGQLIQEAGCKGLSVGRAQVSEKHAGFVINTCGATATDILALIEEVQKRVYEHSGVMLEPEVRIIGG